MLAVCFFEIGKVNNKFVSEKEMIEVLNFSEYFRFNTRLIFNQCHTVIRDKVLNKSFIVALHISLFSKFYFTFVHLRMFINEIKEFVAFIL